MANSAMVCSITRNVGSTSHNSTQSDHIVTRSSGAKALFAGRKPATVGGMEGFRKTLEGEGVSKLTATLITNSRRSGSISNYQSAWKKWASWCYEREVNPFTSNIIEILNFQAFLYEKGYEYSSINSHRSAISACDVHMDNNPIGKYPRVYTLMAGIYNNRPHKPRRPFVWDIETVLNYLSKLPDNLNLPIRVLSHKLALLLSLTAASRVSEICCLNTEYMVEFEDKYVFKFHKLTKSWRKGRPPLSVKFCAYQQNLKLCVVQAIKSFLQVTQAWRNKNS